MITLVPTYTRVKIALDRLNRFNKIISAQLTRKEKQVDLPKDLFGDFSSLRFENVTYEYYDEHQDDTFKLGPINVEIHKGESIIVIGGNGSGKSTFVNILTGLYRPLEGHIYLNGIEVKDENYKRYIDFISAIFTSNFLFSENYDEFDLNEENYFLDELIKLVRLDGIVKFNSERNTIDRNLSKGQQKRLGLIYALLEKKDLLVLDEWAAEQDPVFRAYFYETLIPHFQQLGKTMVIITHDDTYYSLASRVVKFDYGHIVSDKKYAKSEFLS